MHVMPHFSREDVRKAYARKMSPPLGAFAQPPHPLHPNATTLTAVGP